MNHFEFFLVISTHVYDIYPISFFVTYIYNYIYIYPIYIQIYGLVASFFNL
jgi:hypothetical protein